MNHQQKNLRRVQHCKFLWCNWQVCDFFSLFCLTFGARNFLIALKRYFLVSVLVLRLPSLALVLKMLILVAILILYKRTGSLEVCKLDCPLRGPGLNVQLRQLISVYALTWSVAKARALWQNKSWYHRLNKSFSVFAVCEASAACHTWGKIRDQSAQAVYEPISYNQYRQDMGDLVWRSSGQDTVTITNLWHDKGDHSWIAAVVGNDRRTDLIQPI